MYLIAKETHERSIENNAILYFQSATKILQIKVMMLRCFFQVRGLEGNTGELYVARCESAFSKVEITAQMITTVKLSGPGGI